MYYNLSKHAVGGAKRYDSFSGLDPTFRAKLEQMYRVAPRDVRNDLSITSGFRSVDKQRQLWGDALKKYGSVSKARKWVAPPGKSQHGKGTAVDFKYKSSRARRWAHDNAHKFGLHFPLSNENWHIELIGARQVNRYASVAEDKGRDAPKEKTLYPTPELPSYNTRPDQSLALFNQSSQQKTLVLEELHTDSNNPYLKALNNPVKSFNPFLDNPFNERA